MPEKAAFFHFYSAFCFIPGEISGLVPVSFPHQQAAQAEKHQPRLAAHYIPQ